MNRFNPIRAAIPVALAALLAAGTATPAAAALRQVPSEYATLVSAVSAAASGDTVLIAPGTYLGGVWINGKALTIASWFVLTGDTTLIAQTVIDDVASGGCGGVPECSGAAVLEFGDTAHGSAVIGLTITNGEDGIGSASTVDITRCRVVGNRDGVDYTPGSGGVIRNSLFANNLDDGIDLNGRMTLTIVDNEIRDNRDDGIEFRLHAFTGPQRNVTIERNRITGNGEDGIQLIDYPGTHNYVVRIERNLFQTNFDASGQSAAIGCMPDGETLETLVGAPIAERIHVIHNTFVGEKNGVVGGANAIVLNNVFSATTGTSLRRVAGGSIAAYNLLWGGTPHAESNVDEPHTLIAPPLLDAAGIPTAGSPAIDAGAGYFEWQGQVVLDVPSSGYSGSAPDMGAFETALDMPPVVSAGPDLVVMLVPDAVEVVPTDVLGVPPADGPRADAGLDGTVSDDGTPAPATAWGVVSGPGPVAFATPLMPDTRATFMVPGTYVLRLTADDGTLSATDDVEVTVEAAVVPPPPPPPPLERRVNAASDDVEESESGRIVRNAHDLDLVYDSGNQTVGLRFTTVDVPQGATITAAYIQFEADAADSEPTDLILQGQASDDAATFTSADFNVSGRPRTTASAGWSPLPWTAAGEAGPAQRTSGLEAVIQEIVDRPGWAGGNAIAIIITGTGRRSARTQEIDPSGAALLHVEYELPPDGGPAGTASGANGHGASAPPGGATLDGPAAAVTFAFHGVRPQPARGALRIDFTLADDGAAALELLDATGRRMVARDLGRLGPGRHSIELRDQLPVGVYLVRLTQGARTLVRKAVVLR